MAKKLRSPIVWFGGKGHMVNKLLPLIPKHKIYVEPFGGGANLLIAKEPSPVEVYNDLDSGLVNFFRVLRDKEKFRQFYEQVCLIPHSREEFYYCRDTWEKEEDDVMRAVKWFVTARQSFGGIFGQSWGFSVTETVRGMPSTTSKWISAIELLPQVCDRLFRVQIEHKDFREIITAYDTEETFFYLDPPYVPYTRSSGKYNHEMSIKDHEELVEMLLKIKGKAMLSGYDNEIYNKLERNGWYKLCFDVVCSAAGRTRYTNLKGKNSGIENQRRTECVWLSPNCETIPKNEKQLTLLQDFVDNETS